VGGGVINCEHEKRAIQLAIHCTKSLEALVLVYNEYGKSLAVRGQTPNPMFVDVMERFLNDHTDMLKTHAEYFHNQNT
jgi:hypothetical protein